jgi:hypothetical protein
VLRCYGVVSAGWIWARRARICRRRCHMPPVLEVGNVLRCHGVLSAGWIWARRARICRRRRHMPPRRPWTRFGGDVGSGTMTAHAGGWCEWWWRGPCVRVWVRGCRRRRDGGDGCRERVGQIRARRASIWRCFTDLKGPSFARRYVFVFSIGVWP